MVSSNLRYLFIIPIIILAVSCNSSSDKTLESEKTPLKVEVKKAAEKIPVKRAFPPRKNDVERATDTLVLYCLEDKFEAVADKMLYNGDNAQRKWKDSYHIADGSDYEIVRITTDVISDWVEKSDRYIYGKLTEATELGQKMQVQEVIFMTKEDIHRKNFSFILKDGKHYLINIKSPK